MVNALKETLWKQFGASIDMLKNAISMYPDEHWNVNKKFFYNAYHCLVFLDYYLTMPAGEFTARLPFTITEANNLPEDAIDDVIPDRIYSKNEVLEYLQFSREKCRRVIAELTETSLNERWIEDPGSPDTMNYSVLELLLYNLRHVQHHAAQLNLLLRQEINNAPRWVGRAKDELDFDFE